MQMLAVKQVTATIKQIYFHPAIILHANIIQQRAEKKKAEFTEGG